VIALGRAESGPSSDAEQADGIVEQDFTFGPGGTARTAAGTLFEVSRRYDDAAPRHADEVRTEPVVGSEIAWSLRALGPGYSANTYTLSFPLDGETMTGDGVLSEDGAMTVFTARGGATVAVGFGLRNDATASSADLAKRWFVGMQGVRLDGPGSADFSERRAAGIAALDPDGNGGLAPAAGESLQTRTVRLRANVFPAEFSETQGTEAPDGLPSATVGPDGRLSADGGRTSGWIHSGAGLLVARRFDPATRSLSLLLGVRDDGGDYEELFPLTYIFGFNGYSGRTLRASARVVSPGSSAATVASSWSTAAVSWLSDLHTPEWTESHAWTLDWTTLDVGEDDAAPLWQTVARTGSGSASPHAEDGGFDSRGHGVRSPRRGSDAEWGVSVVVSPGAGAIVFHDHGRVGFGVRPRD
jgi:hypothetical protein